MYKFLESIDFLGNIRNIRNELQHDYTLSDKDASELLHALDNVTHDHIKTYTSIKLVGSNATYMIDTGATDGAVTETICIIAKPDHGSLYNWVMSKLSSFL